MAAEVRKAEPRWGALAFGFLGLSIVAFHRLSGIEMVVTMLACALPIIGYVAVFNVRLRQRVQPRPTQRQDLQWARTKEMWAVDRTILPLTFSLIILAAITNSIASSNVSVWVAIAFTFAAATVVGLVSQMICVRSAEALSGTADSIPG